MVNEGASARLEGSELAILWSYAQEIAPHLAAAIFVAVAGWVVAGWAQRAVVRLLKASKTIHPTLVPFVAAMIRYGILAIVFVTVLGQLGITTASLLTVLAAGGLAIGLALQGTLSNVAAGIMLLWLRPFNIGDAIQTDDGLQGEVKEIGLFTTEIRSWDGVFTFVPNSRIWNKTISNYHRNATRRIRLRVNIAYEDDITKARQIILDTATKEPRVLPDPKPRVHVTKLGDNAMLVELRCWVDSRKYMRTFFDLTEQVKLNLERADILIPHPQQTVQWGPGQPRPE